MKEFVGVVVSTKPAKTAVVRVTRLWKHPLYKKTIRRSKKFHAHDELGVKEGDKVKIVESRPLSKLKRWRVVEVIESA